MDNLLISHSKYCSDSGNFGNLVKILALQFKSISEFGNFGNLAK